jgi:Pectate lyase superfamily protein
MRRFRVRWRAFCCPIERAASIPEQAGGQPMIVVGDAKCLAGLTLAAVLLPPSFASYPALAAGCPQRPTSALVVNARQTGAKGDGSTDDTSALQAAFDKGAGTGGTVFVPDGIYMIDAVSERRLKVRSDTTLHLAPHATLRAIPNGSNKYALLTVVGSSNVTITGGLLEGDRARHTGKGGEEGMGLSIIEGAKNVTVDGVTSKEMWGDGFFVSKAQGVTFCSVVADHNRRQGLSVIEADQLEVTTSVFSNTQGTAPSAGIDLEPDDVEQRITNVRIHNSKFLNNKGPGVKVEGKKGTSLVSRLEVTENLFVGEVPVKIEYSPDVLQSGICRNRQIMRRVTETGSLSTYPEPKEVLVVQHECDDSGLQVRR